MEVRQCEDLEKGIGTSVSFPIPSHVDNRGGKRMDIESVLKSLMLWLDFNTERTSKQNDMHRQLDKSASPACFHLLLTTLLCFAHNAILTK